MNARVLVAVVAAAGVSCASVAAAQDAPPPTSRMEVDLFVTGRTSTDLRLDAGRIEVPVVCIKAAYPPNCTGKIKVRQQGSGPHTVLAVLQFTAPEGPQTVLHLPTTRQAKRTLGRRRAVRVHVSLLAVGGGSTETNRIFVPRALGDQVP